MFELLISIIIGSLFTTIGVYFIPIGGSSASLSRNAGISTTTPIIAIVLGMISILSSLYLINESEIIVLLGGSVVSMIVISVIMLFSNIIHIFGVGVVPSTSNFQKDPLTGFEQNNYISPETSGHGIPTISYISGIIGSFIFGFGGSLIFYTIYSQFLSKTTGSVDGAVSAVLSILLFFIIASITAYTTKNNSQGFYDKNFIKNMKVVLVSCLFVSVVIACIYTIILGGL